MSKEGWKKVRLGDVCNMYQPKTISQDEMIPTGKYPVYGANGVIGKYNAYNHELPQLLVTCRGATCGTINISEPYSWITGNSMVVQIKDTSKACIEYLTYYLKQKQIMRAVITGAAQPQITRTNLQELSFVFPLDIRYQRYITTTLDKANELIALRKKQLKELDALAEAVFYEMFGDPVKNEKGWKAYKIKDIGNVITGNTPSRENSNYYNQNYIEWIKTDNIIEGILFPQTAKEFLSLGGLKNGRSVESGAIIMTCIAGSIRSIGSVCLTNRKVSFNQQINAIVPNSDIVSALFLIHLFRLSKKYIQDSATNGMKHIIIKSVLENLLFPLPPITLQTHFAVIIEKIEEQKAQVRKALHESEDLFQRLMQDLFKSD